MAYDVSAFSDYVGRESQALTATLFTGGDTGKFARFMTGIKGKTTIPKITGDATLQLGKCKTPSGTTDVTEESIEVFQWEYYEGFCMDDLQTKFPNTVLAPGSNNADAPPMWQETVVDVKVSSMMKSLELTYWQGDTGGTYSLFDGFIKLIDADGNAIAGNTGSVTSVTVSNIIAVVDAMITATPVDVKESDDYRILIGNDWFDLYIQAVKNANNYHYSPEHADGLYTIGGSNKKLQRVRGLNETSRIYASIGSHFVVGSDLEEEASLIDIWYDKTDDKVYFRTKAKSGVQAVNIDEIVEFTLSV